MFIRAIFGRVLMQCTRWVVPAHRTLAEPTGQELCAVVDKHGAVEWDLFPVERRWWCQRCRRNGCPEDTVLLLPRRGKCTQDGQSQTQC